MEDNIQQAVPIANCWSRISRVEELTVAAQKQGVELNTEEADMILGYLEGHDYCLMGNGEGVTARHDEQYGDDHSEDELYTILNTIAFCQSMNEELLNDSSSQCDPDMKYLSQLQKDEGTLKLLMARLRQTSDSVIGGGI